MLDLLTHLVDKSLVAVDLEHGSEPRYYLLETIRQYAREKLSESGEADSMRDQHFAYFLSLARRAEPQVVGADQRLWFDLLELELDNFRAALEWSLDTGERGAEAGLRMANSLWWFWFLCGYDEDVKWLRKTLAASQTSTDLVTRANALSRLAWADFFDEAAAEEGLALGRTLGLAGRESVAIALLIKGAWAVYQADYTQGKLLAEESLELFRELGHRWGMCEALTWQGMSLINMGDPQLAIAPLEQSLALARQARDGNEIGFALWQLGRAAMARGEYLEATKFMSEGMAIFKELRLGGGVTFVLDDLGKATLAQGDYQQASSHYKEALRIYWDRGSERNIAGSFEHLAHVALRSQQSERAARLMGTAEALRQSSDNPIFPYLMADYDRTLNLLRSQLDEHTIATCWAEGRVMNVKEAMRYALEEDS
jgi:tetratricopeptide (TPR) repeat protein